MPYLHLEPSIPHAEMETSLLAELPVSGRPFAELRAFMAYVHLNLNSIDPRPETRPSKTAQTQSSNHFGSGPARRCWAAREHSSILKVVASGRCSEFTISLWP